MCAWKIQCIDFMMCMLGMNVGWDLDVVARYHVNRCTLRVYLHYYYIQGFLPRDKIDEMTKACENTCMNSTFAHNEE